MKMDGMWNCSYVASYSLNDPKVKLELG